MALHMDLFDRLDWARDPLGWATKTLPWAKDWIWHPSQEATMRKNGRLTLMLRVVEIPELVS